jgi:hypothetical protein
MSSDTWARLTAKYYIADSAFACLSVWQNEDLRLHMDTRKDISTDHIGVLREALRKHGKK